MPAEQVKTPRTLGGGPGGLGDFPDMFAPDEPNNLCTVASGPYGEQLPVANMSVKQIRARYRDRFDIDPQSQALVDGNEVGDDTVIRTGQVLMFSKKAGEKGKRKS
jgi:hypothetical protein